MTCPECGARFRLSEALCDDWRDPDRSFGCPHCGVFLRPETGQEPAGVRAGVLSGLVGTPAFFLLGHGHARDDTVVMVAASAIMLGVLALLFVELRRRPKTYVPTGDRRAPDPTRLGSRGGL